MEKLQFSCHFRFLNKRLSISSQKCFIGFVITAFQGSKGFFWKIEKSNIWFSDTDTFYDFCRKIFGTLYKTAFHVPTATFWEKNHFLKEKLSCCQCQTMTNNIFDFGQNFLAGLSKLPSASPKVFLEKNSRSPFSCFFYTNTFLIFCRKCLSTVNNTAFVVHSATFWEKRTNLNDK